LSTNSTYRGWDLKEWLPLNSPAFADLQAMLVRALADEPAALQKVLAGN